MNINLTNVTEDGILSIVLKIDEDEQQWIQPANRSAVYEALHALVETAEAAEIARIPKDEQAQADTTISGYHAYPEPPDDSLCPFCGIGPCVAMCEPPADDRAYMAAWRSGDFDDELVEHADGLFAVGYERLLGGVE